MCDSASFTLRNILTLIDIYCYLFAPYSYVKLMRPKADIGFVFIISYDL